MQWLGRAANPWTIDREVGDLRDDTLGGREWFTYVRYNAILDAEWMRQALDLPLTDAQASGLRTMDNPANIGELARVGARAAERQVRAEHFPAAFDPAF
jgi:hypothetical protein